VCIEVGFTLFLNVLLYCGITLKHTLNKLHICRGADKSLALPIFLFAAKQQKVVFLDVLKKLGQQSHKCVELKEEYVE
jgi:hypothetical protein